MFFYAPSHLGQYAAGHAAGHATAQQSELRVSLIMSYICTSTYPIHCFVLPALITTA
jgi:hypothetical protein